MASKNIKGQVFDSMGRIKGAAEVNVNAMPKDSAYLHVSWAGKKEVRVAIPHAQMRVLAEYLFQRYLKSDPQVLKALGLLVQADHVITGLENES